MSADDVEWIDRLLVASGDGADDGATGDGVSARDDPPSGRAKGVEAPVPERTPLPGAENARPAARGDGHRGTREEAGAFGMIGLLTDGSLDPPDGLPSV